VKGKEGVVAAEMRGGDEDERGRRCDGDW